MVFLLRILALATTNARAVLIVHSSTWERNGGGIGVIAGCGAGGEDRDDDDECDDAMTSFAPPFVDDMTPPPPTSSRSSPSSSSIVVVRSPSIFDMSIPADDDIWRELGGECRRRRWLNVAVVAGAFHVVLVPPLQPMQDVHRFLTASLIESHL